MKTLKLILLAAVCTGMQAQPLTGLDTYQFTPNVKLSDGHYANLNSNGFLMAGYVPTGSPNLYIEKTDVDGNFNGILGEFANEYKFSDGANPCSTPISPANRCYGMSILEIPGTSAGAWYAMASAFERGCLFSTLKSSGLPLNTAFYTFTGSTPSKALIAKASAGSGGSYYICGSYSTNGNGRFMYILLVNSTGGIVWSKLYNSGSNTSELNPTAILESPYAPASAPELVMVGKFNNGSTSTLEEGFFARFKGTNGTILQFDAYGSGTASNERFNAISAAASPVPTSNGYIIGGYSDSNASSGTSWALKVDPTGAIIWTDLILPSGNTGEITATLERYSSTYTQYEYHLAATDNGAMTVFKLDNNGNLFSIGTNINNEFIYEDNAATAAEPVSISDDNVAGNTNEGIHVYGTDLTAAPLGEYFLSRACFNGAAGNGSCSNIMLNNLPASNVTTGPSTITSPNISTNAGLGSCTNYNFAGSATPVTVSNPCDATSLPAGGDQSRTGVATGIATLNQIPGLSMSPNPVSDKLVIAYTAAPGAELLVTVRNTLGQLVSVPINATNPQKANELTLDFSKLNVESGVYFVTVKHNGLSTTQKIIYNK